MSIHWIRLSRHCQNACVFCDDADHLDGTIVELDDVKAAIDAAKAAGATEVRLSGGEPTLSKHLLAAIKHAKSLELRVSLTTNGRIIKHVKIAKLLEQAGLDAIHVSIHAGRRRTHDQITRREGSWLESLQAMKFCGNETGIETWMNSVVLQPNVSELSYLMHLGTMGGLHGVEIRHPQPLGTYADKAIRSEADAGWKRSTRLMSTLWYEAKEEVLYLRPQGYDHTLDQGWDPEGEPRQADLAAIEMLRRRVALAQAPYGFTLLDEEGMAKNVRLLCDAEGGLVQVGLELAAHKAPILDAPWCAGGVPDDPAAHGEDAHYGEACEACPMRATCPGLPRKVRKLDDEGILRPLPAWTGVSEGTAIVVGGDDALLREATLPDLATALSVEGLTAVYAAEVDDRVDGAALVVCGDVASAHAVLSRPGRAEGQRVVLLDTGLGVGLADLPAPPDLVVSHVPGRVDVYREAGIDLRTVVWRPFPAPARCADAALPEKGHVVCLGETADWRVLEAAVVTATQQLPRVLVLDSEANPAPDTAVYERHTDADDATILDAILHAKAVVLPARRQRTDDAESRRRLARDLRWLAIAHAAGRPIAALRAPGVDDHPRHDHTGWLAPAGGPKGLNEAMRRVVSVANGFQRYAATARKHGAASLPASWAKELVHGVRPTRERMKTAIHPWHAW